MDGKLLSILYEKYSREILLYVYSLSHSWEVAEDITQEVFIKAILSLPDSNSNVRAWLYTVARNLSFNYMRRMKYNENLVEKLSKGLSRQEHTLATIIEDERNRELYDAINSLDARYREVLILQYYQGLSQKEISKILQISPENVRVLVHRAKAKLKEYLEKDHDI